MRRETTPQAGTATAKQELLDLIPKLDEPKMKALIKCVSVMKMVEKYGTKDQNERFNAYMDGLKGRSFTVEETVAFFEAMEAELDGVQEEITV